MQPRIVHGSRVLPLYQRRLGTEKVRGLPKDTQPASGAGAGSQTGPLLRRQLQEAQERWQGLRPSGKYLGADSGLGPGCTRPWERPARTNLCDTRREASSVLRPVRASSWRLRGSAAFQARLGKGGGGRRQPTARGLRPVRGSPPGAARPAALGPGPGSHGPRRGLPGPPRASPSQTRFRRQTGGRARQASTHAGAHTRADSPDQNSRTPPATRHPRAHRTPAVPATRPLTMAARTPPEVNPLLPRNV